MHPLVRLCDVMGWKEVGMREVRDQPGEESPRVSKMMGLCFRLRLQVELTLSPSLWAWGETRYCGWSRGPDVGGSGVHYSSWACRGQDGPGDLGVGARQVRAHL